MKVKVWQTTQDFSFPLSDGSSHKLAATDFLVTVDEYAYIPIEADAEMEATLTLTATIENNPEIFKQV